jgi:protein required for attachment to host cells
MKPVKTWVLIVNSEKAKIFEHLGPGSGLTLVAEIANETPARKYDDEQGRSFDSTGSHRHKMEPPTDVESPFFGEVAERLRKQFDKGVYQRLVLCAGPQNLGALRPHLKGNFEKAVIGELAKNLANTPETELESHFEDILPV